MKKLFTYLRPLSLGLLLMGSILFAPLENIAHAAQFSLVPITNEDIAPKVQSVMPAVVSIVESKTVERTIQHYGEPVVTENDDGFTYTIPITTEKVTAPATIGIGTGFIATTDGKIITAKHVVADADAEYTVVLRDGTQKLADVVYRDPNRDLAVIKIAGTYSDVAVLGDSSKFSLGDAVTAVGTAYGKFAETISTGSITGTGVTLPVEDHDQLEKISGLVEMTAPVVPGYSGGPVIAEDGSVVGVSVAADLASGKGYFIPINNLKDDLTLNAHNLSV
jgi:S1-C subfamily serine protease